MHIYRSANATENTAITEHYDKTNEEDMVDNIDHCAPPDSSDYEVNILYTSKNITVKRTTKYF